MDNWRDPWADDAAPDPPPKQEVKTPPPLPSAPVFLNGFLDDAQWGTTDQDESFGGWTTGTEAFEPDTPHAAEATAVEPRNNKGRELLAEKRDEAPVFDGGWDSHVEEQDALGHSDNVVSEASDSATTVREATSPVRFSRETHVDDDSSTRPSTSPSDVSHTEAHIDSPRTSFEDERNVHESPKSETTSTEESIVAGQTDGNDSISSKAEGEDSSKSDDDDDFRDFEETDVKTELSTPDEQVTQQPSLDGISGLQAPKDESASTANLESVDKKQPQAITAERGLFRPDLSLAEQIYPIPESDGDIATPPDDPISTTAERKAWYRLTRRQTLREFNTGTDDDNYVRVTWMNSHIRSEAGKIVGRWATEDRMSARGQVAAGTFFWDQPAAQAESTTLDRPGRKRPSLPISTQVRPVAHLQSARPETFGGAPAQFNWSTAADVPRSPRENPSPVSPGYRSTSSPLTVKPNPLSRVQQHDRRSVSVDLNRRLSMQNTHKRATSLANPSPFALLSPVTSSRNSMAVDFTTPSEPVHTSSTVIPPPTMISSTPKASLDMGFFDNPSLSTIAPSTQVDAKAEDISNATPPTIPEDDDEWGEMVQSPSKEEFSVIPPILASSISSPTHQSTPKTQAKSIRPPLDTTPTSRHASPIVRLKGVVSPTTARFKFNNFIPPNTESGPIGREMLRKTTPENARQEQTSDAAIAWNQDPTIRQSSDNTPTDEFSNFESSLPQPSSSSSPESKTYPSNPTHTDTDLFSIFDSAPSAPSASQNRAPSSSSTDAFSIFDTPPTVPPTKAPIPPNHDPTDPFSIFETPTPTHIPAAQNSAPPPQPTKEVTITASSNTIQRQKAEDDEVLREILEGLPDLRYMLLR